MVALRVEDLKSFTKQLFIGETFDSFLVREAEIVTFNRFSIDGKVRHGYYSDDELEMNRIERYSSWKTLRPFCFSLIKGSRLPESFHIVLQMPPAGVERFLSGGGLSFSSEQVNGLYINIRYEEQALSLVTGTSVSQFTLDKSLDREWDGAVMKFLKTKQIIFEEQ